jgi:hypothetical protein
MDKEIGVCAQAVLFSLEKKELLSFAATCMNLEDFMFSEMNQDRMTAIIQSLLYMESSEVEFIEV